MGKKLLSLVTVKINLTEILDLCLFCLRLPVGQWTLELNWVTFTYINY